MPSIMNQNLFSLLPYDGSVPSLDAVAAAKAEAKAAAKAKQPRVQPRIEGSKSGESKVQSLGTNIKQTSNGVSNGFQPRNRSYQGNNRGADQAQRNNGVIVGNDSYRRSQYPRNYNGGNGYQRNNGGDSVANRSGENRRVYVQRGSNNGEERRYNKNSNGAGINQPFRSQVNQRQQHGGERRGNGAQQQNQQPAESESKSAEVNNAGVDNNEWQMVASRRKGNVSMNNGHGVVDRRSRNLGGNGQYTARRRASGQYTDNGRSYANSEASNNNERKDDLVVVAAHAGNEDSSNANTTEDSTVPVVEETLRPKVEKKPSVEDEERQRRLAEKKKEREEDAKLKTFKDYQKELREKTVNQTPRERVAALDKELESMQIVGKRKDLLLPLVGEAGSESVASEAETDTKSEKDELQRKKESVCKSIVEVFMKPTSYRNTRPPAQYRGPLETSSGNVKGAATSSRKVKDNAGLESTPKGNTNDPLVKEKKIETVKRKEAEINMNFTDNLQFPAL